MVFPIGSLGEAPGAGREAQAASRTPQAAGPRRLHGALLVAGVAIWLFVVMALLTHDSDDPGFTTSGSGAKVVNAAGTAGAWIADLALFLFGMSVWWLLLAAGRDALTRAAALLRHAAPPVRAPRERWLFGLGLLGLMGASCALESTRLYRWEPWLPGPAGGILGDLLGAGSVRLLGFSGSALVWIAVMVLALPAVLGFSWVTWADRIGAAIDAARLSLRRRRASREDARIGAALAREREWPPEQAMDGTDAGWAAAAAEQPWAGQSPSGVRGARAPGPPVVIQPPVLEVPKSERVERERQKPLFDEMSDQRLPQVDLLDGVSGRQESVNPESLEMTSRLIEKKLGDFGVTVQVVAASPGPVITRYEVEPDTGVKGAQIVNLAKDLARSLGLVSIRVVETVPGRTTMALELPNARRQSIRLSEILGSQPYHAATSMLTLGLGKDIVGAPVVADLAKMPHCLVAGTTGSGKSVGINAMILSLLYKAEARDVRLILIDPKMLEMSVYEGIPHLLCPVVTDMKQAANALNWCVGEMERRYRLMSRMGVRQLSGFNRKIDEAAEAEQLITNPFSLTPEAPEPLQRLPFIVVVIDELADLMMVVGKKIEELIARLAQKARAAGIHLILATQRPSVDVITGLIKANIPTRLSFHVSSKIDSRTILDQMGAEALLGQGDMLYLAPGTGLPTRVHGAFVSDEEVHRVVEYLKSQGEPDYIDGILEGGVLEGDGDAAGGADAGGAAGGENDPMYDQAVAVVLQHRRASISLVQRHLRIGYNRAARLLEQMEQSGLVSGMATNGNRDILVPPRTE